MTRRLAPVPQILAAVSVLTLIALAAGLALAGKPGGGGGGTPSGTIFFGWGSEFGSGGGPPYYQDRGFWTMNADGSGKQLTYRPVDMWDLSHFAHQGHRWFLATGPSPTGSPRGAMYAVRDDGASQVFLVEGADLAGDYIIHTYRWGKDDSFVSWIGINGLGGPEEIWGASITFDADTGEPLLAAPPVAVMDDAPGGIADFDFAPLGDEVVYQVTTEAGNDLVIKDLVTGMTRGLLPNARFPRWSPDGSRIACYAFDDGLYVVNPDGTGALRLANGGSPGNWSPDSKHLLYTRVWSKNGAGGTVYYSDVMRVPASGGGATNLTKDIDGNANAAFWR